MCDYYGSQAWQRIYLNQKYDFRGLKADKSSKKLLAPSALAELFKVTVCMHLLMTGIKNGIVIYCITPLRYGT